MRARSRAGILTALAGVAAAVALAPATGASATPVATTTVHGDVHLGSTALGGYRVGFFDPADGSVITGTTAANGTFSLQVPSDEVGYVFAGTDPDAQRAISAYHGRNFVRGVIGLHAPTRTAGVIFQSLTPGLPDQLADGGPIHLRLQHSGRVAGTGDLPKGSEVTVERLNGAYVGAGIADSHGHFRTPALVPGKYVLVFRGGSSLLARSKTVTVVADRTVTTSVPRLVVGGVIEGTVRSGGTAITHPVTVVVSIGGQIVRQATTSSKGTYRFARLAAGRYTVTFADNPLTFDDDGEPGNQPSSDDYLHSIRHATIPSTLGTVVLNPTVAAAGHITGTGSSTTATVVVERSDGTVVRSVRPSTTSFSVGGLDSGTYTVQYLTKQGALGTRTAVVTAGRTTSLGSVATDASAPTVSGSVSGGPFSGAGQGTGVGSVTFQPERPGYIGTRIATSIAADGSYTAAHLVPGTYTATVVVAHRVTVQRTVTIGATTSHLDLVPGAVEGVLDLSFTTHGRALRAGSVYPGLADASGAPAAGGGEMAPGTYSFHNTITAFDLDQKSPPAYDGPWWWVLPDDTITVTSGATTHVTIDLAIGH